MDIILFIFYTYPPICTFVNLYKSYVTIFEMHDLVSRISAISVHMSTAIRKYVEFLGMYELKFFLPRDFIIFYDFNTCTNCLYNIEIGICTYQNLYINGIIRQISKRGPTQIYKTHFSHLQRSIIFTENGTWIYAHLSEVKFILSNTFSVTQIFPFVQHVKSWFIFKLQK